MRPRQLRDRILAADLAWIPLALAGEQASRHGLHWSGPALGVSDFLLFVVATWLAWTLLSENLQLDGFRGGWRLPAVVSHLLLAVGLLLVMLLAVENVSRRRVGAWELAGFGLALLGGFLAIRWVALRMLRRRYRRGEVNHVVILGSGRVASELAVKFERHPELLCKVSGFLCAKAEFPAPEVHSHRSPAAVTVGTPEVAALLGQHRVNELVLAHDSTSPEILNLVAQCREQGIRVSLVPQPYELYLSRPSLLDLDGLPLLRLGETTPPASARVGKRLLDLVLGSFLALATSPLLAICALRLHSTTGRALRWERRTGWRGVEFSMLRLNVERDPQTGSRFARMLWRLSISELPQFWNVLRGEMSLVGPRPEGPERAHHYTPWQQQRLAVKPGMTGLAQVHGLREQHASEDKTRLDLQYLLHPSPLKDISLLIETMWTLALRLVRLPGRASAKIAGPEADGRPLAQSPRPQPFPELFQHAHRTQSGSD
jgi:lipopolysaccharide/colanic/teichoic acid biosynthesis glycosyltransferase